jgi:hypothetical protein
LRLFNGCNVKETPDVSDGIGQAEALLGLPGFRVLDVVEVDGEVVVTIETTAARAFCPWPRGGGGGGAEPRLVRPAQGRPPRRSR